MHNLEIAWMFHLIADLLEISEDNQFKVRAYRKGAKVLTNLPVDLGDLRNEGKLEEIPGIGKNLAAKIGEILDTGECAYLKELQKKVAPGLREITAIPGLGPKRARLIYRNLGVDSLEMLEQAAKDKKIRELPGMGGKTEQAIFRGLEMLRSRVSRFPLYIAMGVAYDFIEFLRRAPGVTDAEVAGSVRRWKESVKDIDLVVAAEEPERVIELFVKYPTVREVTAKGETKVSVVVNLGIQVELRVVAPGEFWTALHHSTGSKEHNVALRERAHRRGIKINEYGIFRVAEGSPALGGESLTGEISPLELLPVGGEEDIYRHLELDYIPPELREGRGEIEAAEKGELPHIFSLPAIKGDLHLHSNWSDGVNTIPEIAEKAGELGYDYIAITDHTKSLGIARGLTRERLLEQQEYIGELNKELHGITLLQGMEVEILSDGGLDHPDEVLAEADVVIASVHTGFKQDEAKLTGRILKALDNRYVHIVAHPTGRLIGRRDPYAVNVQEVIERAAKNNKILEINSSPDRLDLKDTDAKEAKEKGVRLAINTDAHDRVHMADMAYGVAQARRAWLEEDDVINTYPLEKLRKVLDKVRE